jgi:hypothetical protein
MTSTKKSVRTNDMATGCADPSNPSDTRPTCLNLSSSIRSDIKVAAEMQHTSMSSIIEQGMRSYFQSKKTDKT